MRLENLWRTLIPNLSFSIKWIDGYAQQQHFPRLDDVLCSSASCGKCFEAEHRKRLACCPLKPQLSQLYQSLEGHRTAKIEAFGDDGSAKKPENDLPASLDSLSVSNGIDSVTASGSTSIYRGPSLVDSLLNVWRIVSSCDSFLAEAHLLQLKSWVLTWNQYANYYKRHFNKVQSVILEYAPTVVLTLF